MNPGTIARVVVQEQLRYSPHVGTIVKLLVKHQRNLDEVTRWKVQVLTHNSTFFTLPGNITHVDESNLRIVNPKLMKALYG